MLVFGLIIFLVTFVVPNFAQLYGSMSAKLPADDADPDRGRHHRARLHSAVRRRLVAAVVGFRLLVATDPGRAAVRIDS